ncbi:MAG: hypothetical protein IT215_02205 [Chitinophagaceae bacterium]|nr:hypothetical protein [Chitinophagaceae bacterium]HMN32624.1 hypothetical protein [Chitinophagaceae bacterium]
MKKIIFLSVLIGGLFLSGYVYWFYYNIYSDGIRDGVLYKFSRKGNVFKTYEGELIQPGLRASQRGTSINTNNFNFSVLDEVIADSLQAVIGKTVKLHYIQYRKNLPWRGENYNSNNQENGQYIIDRIEDVRDDPAQNIGF